MNPKQLAMLVTFVLALGLGVAVDAQTVIYVDDDAPPGGDGLSWATAYDSLFTALTAATAGPSSAHAAAGMCLRGHGASPGHTSRSHCLPG